MVLGYHVILSAYGFWLPNDPRGSWSDFVAAWELFRYGGKAVKPALSTSVAHVPHDRRKRLAMKRHLKYQAVRFTGLQARAIGTGFARAVQEAGYVMLACAILHDHVHLVIDRLSRPIGQVVGHLKARATQQLRAEDLHPFERFVMRDGRAPTVWAEKYWNIFIDDKGHLENAIRYVRENPLKEGLPRQHRSFVRSDSRTALRMRSG